MSLIGKEALKAKDQTHQIDDYWYREFKASYMTNNVHLFNYYVLVLKCLF